MFQYLHMLLSFDTVFVVVIYPSIMRATVRGKHSTSAICDDKSLSKRNIHCPSDTSGDQACLTDLDRGTPVLTSHARATVFQDASDEFLHDTDVRLQPASTISTRKTVRYTTSRDRARRACFRTAPRTSWGSLRG